jgi:hypothetical protein
VDIERWRGQWNIISSELGGDLDSNGWNLS